jgi:hypothetical protein
MVIGGKRREPVNIPPFSGHGKDAVPLMFPDR